MEGRAMTILAFHLAVFATGIASLVAFGLLLVRYTRAARILFASGLLSAATVGTIGILSEMPLLVVPSVSLFLAGAGQFIAVFRSARTYAAALGCATVSLVLMASPLLGAEDWGRRLLGGLALGLDELGVPLSVAASLLPAVVSVGIGFWSIQNHGSRVASR